MEGEQKGSSAHFFFSLSQRAFIGINISRTASSTNRQPHVCLSLIQFCCSSGGVCSRNLMSLHVLNIQFSGEPNFMAVQPRDHHPTCVTTESHPLNEWHNMYDWLFTYFLGDTDSSSMVDSSSPSNPKRSLLCFCRRDIRNIIYRTIKPDLREASLRRHLW